MIAQCMSQCPQWGAVDFARVKGCQPPMAPRWLERFDAVQSLICVVFPYFVGNEAGDISIHARGRDYHCVAGEILENACRQLHLAFPQNRFEKYVDIDPINEVYAAACAGLGVIGASGLLITPKWGSYVFVGIIATDMRVEGGSEPQGCISCGACRTACPVGLDKSRCLSHLTQKKGELTAEEQMLLAAHPLIWGCDICQTACPMNKAVHRTGIAAFQEDLLYNFPEKDIYLSEKQFKNKYGNKSFAWRGVAPIKRNILLRREMMNIKIRAATPADLETIISIENICYPAGEAASRVSLDKRMSAYKTCFFVAEKDGKIVGHINGSILNTTEITDEMFENIALHDESAVWQGVFGLGVLPEYRRQGIAEQMMNTLIEAARKAGRKGLFLDCKEHLEHYYAKFGYEKVGLSKSQLGGAVWYDMVLTF